MPDFLKAAALAVALLACPVVAGAADASGTWTGPIAIHFADGRVLNDSAWLQLRQQDTKLEGTAGPAPDRQKPIRTGVVVGDELSFVTDSTNGKELKFVLRSSGEKLSGEALGEIGADSVRVSVELARVTAAGAPRDALFDEISACDARLFDAYNRRDFEGVMAMFTKDLEFYHDRGGLTGYAQNRKNFRNALTEKTRHRRELVPGTLQISRLGDRFALETGIHRFYDTAPGEPERLAATAQFVNVWQRDNGGCKLRRVISFDHR
jgi:ketosteroid isomerase-like protein